jgi:glycosyltransferase involved in cell wall biosynthesis
MKKEHPLVSIVIPTYNQAEFLKEAIASAQKQTYPHIEIIVVNDGSTDDTQKILEQLSEKDSRIHFFNQSNKGFGSATNRAIQESLGNYIAHLDSDDLYEPEKIEKQFEVLHSDKNIDIVHTAVQLIDRNGDPLKILRGNDLDPDTFLAQMLFRNIMPNPNTMMGKRECFLEVPCSEKYKRSVDYDRALRLAAKYRFKYLDLPLTRWRRHEQNISNDLEKHRQEQLAILKGYPVEDLMRYVDKAKLNLEDKTLLQGNILYNIEQWEQALEKFQEVETPSGYFYAGNCLVKMEQKNEAVKSYLRCLQQNPMHAASWNNLGVALGELKEASACFDKAIKINPDYLDPQYNLSHPDKRLTERELRNELIPYKL